ncbi:HEPN domain-containing protein [Pararhodospirillum oryzae]|uniref:HEPN domain-containing protein n=1 Tax=Pararhodospirillum oryzae TaxID=478448 RepID=A0A512H882_9PROT|nr:HEPN domain-containing protein [Pararhodospirillum oryzae]GEO81664.1 hypothetical protein ROR02_17950 [Pararhodospirillum oryzae]
MTLVVNETPGARKSRQQIYDGARGYHLRAEQFAQDNQRPSLIFNVGSVAIEHYLVALCAAHGRMPLNHTYTDLLETVEEVTTLPDSLADEIRALDRIFGLCSLEHYHHGTPEEEDAQTVLRLCRALHDLVPCPDPVPG